MLLLVEQNVAANPVNVGLFSPAAVVLHTYRRTDPVEELRGRRGVRRVRIGQRRETFGHSGLAGQHRASRVPAGQIGVVIAQVGQPLPIGAKSAVYKPAFGNFTDLNTFIESLLSRICG